MLVDLHAHYPMHLIPPERRTHAALTGWRSQRWRARIVDAISRLANYEGPGGEPGVTVELMRQGDVGAVLSVLYSPFDEIDLAKRYRDPPDPAYFGRLLEQLDLVEADIATHAADARIARSAAELDACLAEGRIAVMHAVEGGFHLGREPDVPANVAELARRGVVYVTLAHLFHRGVATNTPALPFLPDWLYRLLFPQPREGLSALGRTMVRELVRHRVLVDITHMSARSLADTFALLDELDPAREIPVLASHMACRLGSLAYCCTDETIARVAERGGVLGVIDCRHYVWDGARRPAGAGLAESVDRICAHIDRIAAVTGSFDHAAVGTDLDGYVKPALDGLEHLGRMRALQDALTARYGASRASRLCRDNALRLLRAR